MSGFLDSARATPVVRPQNHQVAIEFASTALDKRHILLDRVALHLLHYCT
jgi:hypothetical protein